MKASGAKLVRLALEQLGVKYTFGIPGVHTVEIYDELGNSSMIKPVLVTHEGGASFMADAISRTTDSIGTLVLVPGAGITHAASGIAEAFLDGIPMLIITGGIRRDSGRFFQLHQIDQQKLSAGMVKKYFLASTHQEIIPTLHEAYRCATGGGPGPVLVEIPAELQLTVGEVDVPAFISAPRTGPTPEAIREAAELLRKSQRPVIYAGWGAHQASRELKEIAELLQAPVATTLQGLSVFPFQHELHTGMGFGKSAVPAAENAFSGHDCMLAVGARFAELATGSYGIEVSGNLIHVDINPEVLQKNFPARVALNADAGEVLTLLLKELRKSGTKKERNETLLMQIQRDKESYRQQWTKEKLLERVSPGYFFEALNEILGEDDFLVCDDGNHTFLAGELYHCRSSRHFLCPTDFNAMGYCVPAAIATKLSHPTSKVAGIVGDGGFLMTGMELLTARAENVGVVIFVFHDGELGQISQFQKIPLNRKTCTVLSEIKISGVAEATGAHYLEINGDRELRPLLEMAFALAAGNLPVLVDVRIDYSKKTRYTTGVVKTSLARFPLGDKARFIGRAMKRHLWG